MGLPGGTHGAARGSACLQAARGSDMVHKGPLIFKTFLKIHVFPHYTVALSCAFLQVQVFQVILTHAYVHTTLSYRNFRVC